MTNQFIDFISNNLKEIIIGIAVATIITLLGKFTLQEGITLIILGALVSLVLNQLTTFFVPNEKNQRTALIILVLLGGFFLMQGFQVGIYSTTELNQVVNVIEPQGMFKTITAPIAKLALGKTGFFGTIGAISSLAFFMNPILGIIVLIVLLLFIGIPFIGFSIAIFQNFQLIIIILGLVALAFLVFKTKRIRAVT